MGRVVFSSSSSSCCFAVHFRKPGSFRTDAEVTNVPQHCGRCPGWCAPESELRSKGQSGIAEFYDQYYLTLHRKDHLSQTRNK